MGIKYCQVKVYKLLHLAKQSHFQGPLVAVLEVTYDPRWQCDSSSTHRSDPAEVAVKHLA